MTDGPGRDPGGRYGSYETGSQPQDAVTRIEIERRAAEQSRTAGADPGRDTESRHHTASDAKEAVRDTVREAREALEHRAEERAERGKYAITGQVDSFARALRRAGDTLDDEGHGDLARYGRHTADRVERFADYLDRRDIGGLLHDLQDTARTRPGVFLGSTFAAGLLLGRFLRAGTPEPSDAFDSPRTGDYDEPYGFGADPMRTYEADDAFADPLASPPERGYEARGLDTDTLRPGAERGTERTERQDLR